MACRSQLSKWNVPRDSSTNPTPIDKTGYLYLPVPGHGPGPQPQRVFDGPGTKFVFQSAFNLCLPVLRFTVKVCYSYIAYLYKP